MRKIKLLSKDKVTCVYVIHILTNISRSKGNQAMKTGQFIE